MVFTAADYFKQKEEKTKAKQAAIQAAANKAKSSGNAQASAYYSNLQAKYTPTPPPEEKPIFTGIEKESEKKSWNIPPSQQVTVIKNRQGKVVGLEDPMAGKSYAINPAEETTIRRLEQERYKKQIQASQPAVQKPQTQQPQTPQSGIYPYSPKAQTKIYYVSGQGNVLGYQDTLARKSFLIKTPTQGPSPTTQQIDQATRDYEKREKLKVKYGRLLGGASGQYELANRQITLSYDIFKSLFSYNTTTFEEQKEKARKVELHEVGHDIFAMGYIPDLTGVMNTSLPAFNYSSYTTERGAYLSEPSERFARETEMYRQFPQFYETAQPQLTSSLDKVLGIVRYPKIEQSNLNIISEPATKTEPIKITNKESFLEKEFGWGINAINYLENQKVKFLENVPVMQGPVFWPSQALYMLQNKPDKWINIPKGTATLNLLPQQNEGLTSVQGWLKQPLAGAAAAPFEYSKLGIKIPLYIQAGAMSLINKDWRKSFQETHQETRTMVPQALKETYDLSKPSGIYNLAMTAFAVHNAQSGLYNYIQSKKPFEYKIETKSGKRTTTETSTSDISKAYAEATKGNEKYQFYVKGQQRYMKINDRVFNLEGGGEIKGFKVTTETMKMSPTEYAKYLQEKGVINIEYNVVQARMRDFLESPKTNTYFGRTWMSKVQGEPATIYIAKGLKGIELESTVAHELLHFQHPKIPEPIIGFMEKFTTSFKGKVDVTETLQPIKYSYKGASIFGTEGKGFDTFIKATVGKEVMFGKIQTVEIPNANTLIFQELSQIGKIPKGLTFAQLKVSEVGAGINYELLSRQMPSYLLESGQVVSPVESLLVTKRIGLSPELFKQYYQSVSRIQSPRSSEMSLFNIGQSDLSQTLAGAKYFGSPVVPAKGIFSNVNIKALSDLLKTTGGKAVQAAKSKFSVEPTEILDSAGISPAGSNTITPQFAAGTTSFPGMPSRSGLSLNNLLGNEKPLPSSQSLLASITESALKTATQQPKLSMSGSSTLLLENLGLGKATSEITKPLSKPPASQKPIALFNAELLLPGISLKKSLINTQVIYEPVYVPPILEPDSKTKGRKKTKELLGLTQQLSFIQPVAPETINTQQLMNLYKPLVPFSFSQLKIPEYHPPLSLPRLSLLGGGEYVEKKGKVKRKYYNEFKFTNIFQKLMKNEPLSKSKEKQVLKLSGWTLPKKKKPFKIKKGRSMFIMPEISDFEEVLFG